MIFSRLALLSVLLAPPAIASDFDESCPEKVSLFARIAGPHWPREFALAAAVLGPLGGVLTYQLTDGFRAFHRERPAAPVVAPAEAEVIEGMRPLVAPEWHEVEGDKESEVMPLPSVHPVPAAGGGESPATYGLPR